MVSQSPVRPRSWTSRALWIGANWAWSADGGNRWNSIRFRKSLQKSWPLVYSRLCLGACENYWCSQGLNLGRSQIYFATFCIQAIVPAARTNVDHRVNFRLIVHQCQWWWSDPCHRWNLWRGNRFVNVPPRLAIKKIGDVHGSSQMISPHYPSVSSLESMGSLQHLERHNKALKPCIKEYCISSVYNQRWTNKDQKVIAFNNQKFTRI